MGPDPCCLHRSYPRTRNLPDPIRWTLSSISGLSAEGPEIVGAEHGSTGFRQPGSSLTLTGWEGLHARLTV